MGRLIGIEIEFLATGDVTGQMRDRNLFGQGWVEKGDGSLDHRRRNERDYEVASPPMDSASPATWSMVKDALAAIRAANGRVNRSCGLHVHVDARDLVVADVHRVLKSYYSAQDAIDLMVPRSRRDGNSEYCSRPQSNRLEDAMRATTIQSMGAMGRYVNVNLQSYPIHGTIEFRQHSGTLTYQKIHAWSKFVLAHVESAVANRTVRESLDDMLADLRINRRLRRYWQRRVTCLSGA